MTTSIYLNNRVVCPIDSTNYEETVQYISQHIGLRSSDFYLEQNGRLCRDHIDVQHNVHCVLRVCGGKGGFGSMLRAIGAQIEKTTNREACRDLSGRRLRDINEEKRLKAWLEKQGEREREAVERKKRKIEKLLAVPKHEFRDAEYDSARSKLTDKVNDAVEEGFKKVEAQAKQSAEVESQAKDEIRSCKRKANKQDTKMPVKKKAALWIGDDLETDSTSDDSDALDDDSKTSSTDSAKVAAK